MPKVGDKHFTYSAKGKKAAKAYAKKTGQSVGKYYGGGGVDPFSTRNPEGVPAEQMAEAMENQNRANKGIPTANAKDRSQTMPDIEKYDKGGKVKSTYSASKTWKDVRKKAKEAGHLDTYGKPTAKKLAQQTTDILGQGHRGQSVGDIVKTIAKSNKRKKK